MPEHAGCIRGHVGHEPIRTTVGELAIAVAIGAVGSDGLARASDLLVDAADTALLAAKRAGKNRTVIAPGPASSSIAA